MSNITCIDGVEYIKEEISGKGLCYVPTNQIKDIKPGDVFKSWGCQVVIIEINGFGRLGREQRYLLTGLDNNPFKSFSDDTPKGLTKDEMIAKLKGQKYTFIKNIADQFKL